MPKAIPATIIAVLFGCIGLPMLLLSAVLGGPGGCTPPVPKTSGQPGIGRWDHEQISIAATIVDVGAAKGVPRWGWVVALATAMQESQLRNRPHIGENNEHDSIGVFQQRPSQGWGTPQQLADPAYQTERFYAKLLAVPGWEQMPLTQAAQAVQQSTYPSAYSKWTSQAVVLADALSSTNGNTSPEVRGYCGATGTWTPPVLAPIVSGFRTESRPSHDGVDLSAARGTPIRAASAGTVTAVRCNVIPESHGCDQDGDPENVKGCGWYVDLEHAGGVVTRYCHMLGRPYVETGNVVVAGQVIGLVGSSGHSSGPHLHFEVHLDGDRSSRGAVNPVIFMASMGAPLGLTNVD
jgi:murein DD-endopeptidase MepM/ murein hydrolase activator NlpD